MHWCRSLAGLAVMALVSAPAFAQERAYFVTSDHYLEEVGNVEVAFATTSGLPKDDHAAYAAPWLEIEYGVTGWWTAELYLEGVMSRDGSAYTGWRLENRFRPLKSEHAITPVLYFEYENINEASRIQKEIVGSGSLAFEPVKALREEHAHEIEAKLILSSVIGPWNLAENIIVEKNLSEDEGFEFGYSVGASRSLGALARRENCRLCAENFRAGIEWYGGLGTSEAFSIRGARHYVAPVVSWRVSDRSALKFSTAFGLSEASDHVLFRLGWAYEFDTRGGR